MKKQINETLLELIVGILLSGAVIEAGCIVITGYSRAFTSGLCIGLVLAIGLAAHMYRSIDHALDMQPDDAEKYMRKAYMIRAAAILIVAGIVTRLCDGDVRRSVLSEVRRVSSAGHSPGDPRKRAAESADRRRNHRNREKKYRNRQKGKMTGK